MAVTQKTQAGERGAFQKLQNILTGFTDTAFSNHFSYKENPSVLKVELVNSYITLKYFLEIFVGRILREGFADNGHKQGWHIGLLIVVRKMGLYQQKFLTL